MADNAIAYGFTRIEHLMAARLADVNVTEIITAIQESVDEHNRQTNGIVAAMVQRTVEFKRRYHLPVGGTLQPLDDNGNPLPVRGELHYDVAFPIQGGGTAFGDNRIARALATVADVNRATIQAQEADADWMKRHILAALFTNVTWSFDDPLQGSLTVQPLANSDTVTYLKKNGTTATDTHFLAQAAAIADATNPFPTIFSELDEHPGNNGAKIAYVPDNLTSTITALSDFHPVADPDIALGANTDRLSASIDRGFGDEVLGKADKVWVVRWSALPDSYMIARDADANDVLCMREYDAAAVQGLFTELHSPDGNLKETRLLRYAGFGANNRVGALAYLIGNASYSVPTGYTVPLAV